jgi:hypothetical protein
LIPAAPPLAPGGCGDVGPRDKRAPRTIFVPLRATIRNRERTTAEHKFQDIWKEQCAAARTVGATWKALRPRLPDRRKAPDPCRDGGDKELLTSPVLGMG